MTAKTRRGKLVVVSGPSGCGKTSVIDVVLQDPRFVRAITATTRPRRGEERDGVDYYFLGEEEFRRGIAEGRFLEWAEVYGRLYGTPREPLERALFQGLSVLLNIDTQGARSLREQRVPGIYVFLLPPSLEVLEERLRGRGTESEEALRRRLAQARSEMAEASGYDHTVVNQSLERAAEEIRRLVLGEEGEEAGT